jgi:hypothetical protein
MLHRKSKTQVVKQERNMQTRNCAFELFKSHCAATINAKNASFRKKFFKRKERNYNLLT